MESIERLSKELVIKSAACLELTQWKNQVLNKEDYKQKLLEVQKVVDELNELLG